MGVQEDLEALKRKRSAAKGVFSRKVTLFKEGVARGDSHGVVETFYDAVNKSFDALEKKCGDLITFINDNGLEDGVVEEVENYILDCERIRNEVHVEFNGMGGIPASCVSSNPKIKVKAFEPPKFDGNLRNYPSFKDDFSKLVKASYGADPYALRMCLGGEALQTVRGAEGDFHEMFKRLDEKYGNPRKIVDLVTSDLRSLKRIAEGDTKAFINMVDKVEQCWLDLKRVNLSTELSTANVVSHIEKILPTLQKREWVLKAENISDPKDLFPELLEFLLREKRVLDYMSSSVRSGAWSADGAKGSVHNIYASHENAGEADALSLVKKFQNEQKVRNQEFEQCIVNLTKLVTGNVRIGGYAKGGRCWLHNTDSHDIFSCTGFKNLSDKERYEATKSHGVCFRCLNGYHLSRDCNDAKTCDVVSEGVLCGRGHHPLLHHNTVSGSTHNAMSRSAAKTLLNISTVFCRNLPLTVLWDSGSDISLITHGTARKLGLKGKEVNLSMIKVGNVTEYQSSKEYWLPLIDRSGNLCEISVIGIEEISANVEKVDVSKLKKLFEGVSGDISRPHGKIDVLIGTNYCELLPKVIRTNGSLQLLENQFGLSIRGKHESISGAGSKSHHLVVRTHKLSCNVGLNEISVEHKDSLKASLDRFFTVEEMGMKCDPRCVLCMCRNCPGTKGVSLKEERELALIKKGLVYDVEGKVWVVHYPWVRDPKTLRNNVKVAFARLHTTENRLRKLGTEYAIKYHAEIENMVSRGVARKLSHQEINDYEGPVHYIQHHEVLKPDSSSTPVRIVFNSSACYMGQKLNDYWAKGPDIMNNLLGVLLRFRQDKVAYMGDISKMYHTVKLSVLDQHTHRFLWRDLESGRQPDHYVMTSVTFGDKPSGIIATLALRGTVERFKDGHEEVCDVITNNTYVDDILHSTDNKEKAYRLMKETEEVLSFGNFRVKYWVVSGVADETEINVVETESEKVLGLKWNPKDDCFRFKVRVNFSPKVRKVRSGPDLGKNCIEANFPTVLTRRMVLSQVATIYDPLGLIVPITLRAKWLMRTLVSRDECKGGINWDEPLEKNVVLEWRKFFTEIYGLEELTFRRSLKPDNAVGSPTLVMFSDGSTQAYGACAYARWQVSDGGYVARLIMAKNRIAPLRQLSTPRLELCGALVAVRLRETIVKEFNWSFERIIHCVDSMIVRSQIQKESYGFNTFVATRIAEIQMKTDSNEWWWVDSNHNPADIATRPCMPDSIGAGSVWQNGPRFLTLPINEWPIHQGDVTQLPDRIGVTMSVINASKSSGVVPINVIDVKRFSSYSKLIRVTSRVIRAIRGKSLRCMFEEPTAKDLMMAESVWIKDMQKDMTDWSSRYRRLGPAIKDGIVVVGRRISKWLKDNWNQEEFILIPANHPVTRLYISDLHSVDHAGIETTLSKLQTKFWVPRARKVIKSIKQRCVVCRRLETHTEGQSMGQVIDNRLSPAPPFYYTAVDLFGPFSIKDTVKRRTCGKAFGVIFNCIVTRAVYLDLTEGYSTNDFLTTLQRFTSIRGYPKVLYSDNGPQFKLASKEIKKYTEEWNVKDLNKFGSNKGMEWVFNTSDAPWQNGVSESLIKSVKRNLCIVIGDSRLTFGELQTAMFIVANLMNERPIGLKPGFSLERGTYLCPNDLLLGRTGLMCPSGCYTLSENNGNRLRFIKNIVDAFWKKWQRDYFPTMIIRQKWHTEKRNLKVGDIVLVQDSNAVRGTWKLAQVVQADPGRDKLVRDVKLRYKLTVSGKGYEGEGDKFINRSVHRLVLLLPVEEQDGI